MLLLNKKKEIIGSIEEELIKLVSEIKPYTSYKYDLENARKFKEIIKSHEGLYLKPEVNEFGYGSILHEELTDYRRTQIIKTLTKNIQYLDIVYGLALLKESSERKEMEKLLAMIDEDANESVYSSLKSLNNDCNNSYYKYDKKNKTSMEVPLIKPVTYDNPFRYIKNISNPFEDKITHINHDIHSQMTRPSHPGDINESCYYNNQQNPFCNNDNKIDEETDLLGLSKNLNDLLVVESACLYDTDGVDMILFTDNDGDEINMKYKDLSIMYKEDGDNNNIFTIVNGMYKINLTLSKDRILYVSRKDSTIFINIICK